MTTPDYDVIIAGLGAMGSAAAYHLARRGKRVLGLDPNPPGHTLGSSHGESRIIRLAYSEHPDYVPLLLRAYQLWQELEQRSGQQLFLPTGGLFLGRPEARTIAGAIESARAHGLEYEVLDPATIRKRFPAFAPADDEVGVFEPPAGVLFPERCIEAHLTLASADLRFGEPVHQWRDTTDGIEIETPNGRYQAEQLVLTAGAWLGKLLPDVPLNVERNVVAWFKPQGSLEQFNADRMPVWLWDDGEAGTFYGIPHLDWPGTKAARHHSREACDPDTVDRAVNDGDLASVLAFVAKRMPQLGEVEQALACLYTNTPDGHFIIDRYGEHIVYASACSGHGFKMSSVVGEILADMATGVPPNPSAAFLRADRLR